MSRDAITPELIVGAYRAGYFPMAAGIHGEIGFYHYDPRGIIPLDERFAVRKSLAKFIASSSFRVTSDLAFEAVMRGCSRHGDRAPDEIWISEELIGLYCRLHEMGIAHSIEVFDGDELVGGLYGLVLGAAFCGESMFSRRPYASQVALVSLVERLRVGGFRVLDAQMESEHLKQFGLYTVSQTEYMRLLDDALRHEAHWEQMPRETVGD
ncbi:MAG: leucyl/phenylalanyl-tRNA--protein transferase [Bacteroidetes bacterium]|nr:leucyl/phenylalanyl-tRNA--protein transferase [Bacteroidota bacterium]